MIILIRVRSIDLTRIYRLKKVVAARLRAFDLYHFALYLICFISISNYVCLHIRHAGRHILRFIHIKILSLHLIVRFTDPRLAPVPLTLPLRVFLLLAAPSRRLKEAVVRIVAIIAVVMVQSSALIFIKYFVKGVGLLAFVPSLLLLISALFLITLLLYGLRVLLFNAALQDRAWWLEDCRLLRFLRVLSTHNPV